MQLAIPLIDTTAHEKFKRRLRIAGELLAMRVGGDRKDAIMFGELRFRSRFQFVHLNPEFPHGIT